MSGSSRPHFVIPSLVAASAMVADGDQITLSVSFELVNDGTAAARAVAWDMVLMPLIVPAFPGDGSSAEIQYPPGPKTLLNGLLDRTAEVRSALNQVNHIVGPRESRRSKATCGLANDLLRGAGSLWADRSFVPLFYVAISYLSADDGAFYQTGCAFQVRVRDHAQREGTSDPVLDRLPIQADDLVIKPFGIVGVVEREG